MLGQRPPWRNASTYFSGSTIIKWQSSGRVATRFIAATTARPQSQVGAKRPSIASTSIQSAPAASTARNLLADARGIAREEGRRNQERLHAVSLLFTTRVLLLERALHFFNVRYVKARRSRMAKKPSVPERLGKASSAPSGRSSACAAGRAQPGGGGSGTNAGWAARNFASVSSRTPRA